MTPLDAALQLRALDHANRLVAIHDTPSLLDVLIGHALATYVDPRQCNCYEMRTGVFCELPPGHDGEHRGQYDGAGGLFTGTVQWPQKCPPEVWRALQGDGD